MNRKAFTLVELLVVIVIIGMLAAMVSGAAVMARRRAKIAVVALEVKQLEMACQSYKEKFGEYPPDFSNVGATVTPPELRDAARRIVLRHLSRAFPRYIPGITTASTADNGTWAGFVADVNDSVVGWGINPENLTPQNALVFWLGGMPGLNTSGTSVTGFNGFGADPQNPFNRSSSRIKSLFEFDPSRSFMDATTKVICYWPQGATGDLQNGAIVYFRAENKKYEIPYMVGATQQSTSKSAIDRNIVGNPTVCPSVDTRLSNLPGLDAYDSSKPVTSTWLNPASFQVISSGLDVVFANPLKVKNETNSSFTLTDRVYFPTGENYDRDTYDDIANFSNGTLEDSTP